MHTEGTIFHSACICVAHYTVMCYQFLLCMLIQIVASFLGGRLMSASQKAGFVAHMLMHDGNAAAIRPPLLLAVIRTVA